MSDPFTLHAELPVRPSMLEGMKRERRRRPGRGLHRNRGRHLPSVGCRHGRSGHGQRACAATDSTRWRADKNRGPEGQAEICTRCHGRRSWRRHRAVVSAAGRRRSGRPPWRALSRLLRDGRLPDREGHPPMADGAAEILAFTRALVRRTDDLATARTTLRAKLGDAGTAAVAGSVGNFEMMNRILDATGVPTPGTITDIEQRLRI